MKKLIIALLFMSLCVVTSYAQALGSQSNPYKIISSAVFTVKGATADTLINAGSNTYYFNPRPFSDQFRVGVEADSVRGTAALTTIVQASLDNVNYVAIDTITISGTGNNQWAETSLLTPVKPYVRVITSQATTGTYRIKYYILNHKPY